MFQLLEIIGVSENGFSEAVKEAVIKISDAGEKVFWFEVIEQRGALRNAKIQYQVKLKVAVAVEAAEDDTTYICPSCGKTADEPQSLCQAKKA